MKKEEGNRKPGSLSRRAFLGSSAAAGAATVITHIPGAEAQQSTETTRPVSVPPSAEKMEREVGGGSPPPVTHAVHRAGSDLMVEVLRDLDIEFVASNPGSSFEGLQESIINHGDPPNRMPEFISALHEESAVDMAHGYARAEGRPMCALVQGTIGLQHASMAIYQAFHGHMPMIIIAGNDEENFLQAHSAQDIAGLVRPFTKWDAHPRTLDDTLVALQEAYRQAITPPRAPTLVILDSAIQKEEAGEVQVPVFQPPEFPTIDQASAQAIAEGLLKARNPHLSVGLLRTPAGVESAVRLAELTGASVDGRATAGPMSFPQRHPLSGPGADEEFDYVLGLETTGDHASIASPKLAGLDGRDETGINFGWNPSVASRGARPAGTNNFSADAESSLPLIVEAVESAMSPEMQKTVADRTERNAAANRVSNIENTRRAVEQKRQGWNASPISLARIYAELWPLIKDLDWCLASPTLFSGGHHATLWDHDKPYSYLGSYPAAALGYTLGACTGAALAARDRDRIVIDIQGDGDLNYVPGSLWTAAHHRLPLLIIMHNNRAWHMELMYLTYMAGVRGRGTDRAHIGTTFRDPYIDYARIAEGYGVKSEGPISDPAKLLAALERGVETVRNGEPYLIDVLTQPR